MKAKIGTIGEITGKVQSLEREGDTLKGVMWVGGQVPWHIEGNIGRSDMRTILKLAMKPSVIWFALTSLVIPGKPEETSDDSDDMDW